MRILLVDDNSDLLSATAGTLKALGFDTCCAFDAEQALQLMQAPDHIEVLFTDVVMPGMNGVDLAHRVRQLHPETAVVLTSGYTPPDTPLPQDWQFIKKPYTVFDVVTAIRIAD